jgi:hypothetical protein
LAGVIGAAVAAAIWPFFAIAFSELTAAMVMMDGDKVGITATTQAHV